MKQKDFQWAIWLIIAIISVIASSCETQTSPDRAVQIAQQDSIKSTQYPYQWADELSPYRNVYTSAGRAACNEILSFTPHAIACNSKVFIGDWKDKNTFISSDSVVILVTSSRVHIGKPFNIAYSQ